MQHTCSTDTRKRSPVVLHARCPLADRRAHASILPELTELRIVDDELWHAVQARLALARESAGVTKAIAIAFWKQRRARHLLTGLACCGICGKPLAPVGRDYLACDAARRQGTCGSARSAARLESVILEALRARLMQPGSPCRVPEAYQQEINRQRAGADAARERTSRELAQVERKLAGLARQNANSLRVRSLQQTLEDLEQRRRAELTKQLAAAPAPLPRSHRTLAGTAAR